MSCKFCFLVGQFIRKYSRLLFQIPNFKSTDSDQGSAYPFWIHSSSLFPSYVTGLVPLLKFL